jgi:hypothetical protein
MRDETSRKAAQAREISSGAQPICSALDSRVEADRR